VLIDAHSTRYWGDQSQSKHVLSYQWSSIGGNLSRIPKPIRNRIRAFNKHILNPIILKIAGAPRSPIALIHHIGRRSGQHYLTPVVAQPIRDGFVIALTYGPSVDWYRNIMAGGQCSLGWGGREYVIEKLDAIHGSGGMVEFPAAIRLILRILGVDHYLRVGYQAVEPTLT
jgi:hypothetical protein